MGTYKKNADNRYMFTIENKTCDEPGDKSNVKEDYEIDK